jgi:type IV pilus assembly protein PilN
VALAQSKTGKKVVEFTLVVGIKRPRDKDDAIKAAGPGAIGQVAAAGNAAGAAAAAVPK